ncbi:MAG: GNAT family N-acetyltransferase [Brevinematales bacterium]
MKKGVSFRQATIDDLDRVVYIEKSSFSPDEAFGRRQILYLLSNQRGSVFSEILLWGEEMVGWACWLGRGGSRVIRLYSIALLPSYQGKGIAEEYLRMRLTKFALSYSFCHLEVRVSNERACALYTRLGFTVKERLEGYYGDEDGYRMRLDLRVYKSL